MHYVISDIHGCYSEFLKMLEVIDFKDEDVLYILGDIIDRGDTPIKILQYIKNKSNIKMILGNHEVMMLDFYKQKKNSSNNKLYDNAKELWEANGGYVTMQQLCHLEKSEYIDCLNYIENLKYFDILTLNDVTYLLVHAGFYPYKDMDLKTLMNNQTVDDLVWIRTQFFQSEIKYPFKTIFGHTPISYVKKDLFMYDKMLKRLGKEPLTKIIKEDKIIYFNNKIGIDGACVYGNYLTCLRLEDGEEFFIVNKSIYFK